MLERRGGREGVRGRRVLACFRRRFSAAANAGAACKGGKKEGLEGEKGKQENATTSRPPLIRQSCICVAGVEGKRLRGREEVVRLVGTSLVLLMFGLDEKGRGNGGKPLKKGGRGKGESAGQRTGATQSLSTRPTAIYAGKKKGKKKSSA